MKKKLWENKKMQLTSIFSLSRDAPLSLNQSAVSTVIGHHGMIEQFERFQGCDNKQRIHRKSRKGEE